MEVTYWAWVRTQDGNKINIGNSIRECDLSSVLADYSNTTLYKNIFYGRN